MQTEERVKCCGTITSGGGGLHYCSRWAVVTRDGKPYCKQHDPERIKESQAVPWPAGVTHSQKLDATLQNALELRQSQRTLSRETAIKLVEAASAFAFTGTQTRHKIDLHSAMEAAKRELGI